MSNASVVRENIARTESHEILSRLRNDQFTEEAREAALQELSERGLDASDPDAHDPNETLTPSAKKNDSLVMPAVFAMAAGWIGVPLGAWLGGGDKVSANTNPSDVAGMVFVCFVLLSVPGYFAGRFAIRMTRQVRPRVVRLMLRLAIAVLWVVLAVVTSVGISGALNVSSHLGRRVANVDELRLQVHGSLPCKDALEEGRGCGG